MSAGVASARYLRRLPRLTNTFTRVPRASLAPGRRLWRMIRPVRTFAE